MHPPRFLAIEIGGTKLQLFAGDATGNILDRQRHTVDSQRGGAGIRAAIEQALPDLLAKFNPAAIGVGFGGPVDWRTGRVCCSHQIEGWHNFELGDWLRERTGRPVAVDNDANVAAFGEAHRGAGEGFNPVFYVTLGSGVGGGLVVNGAIFHGARPGESEIGHLRIDRSGTLLEDRCSGWSADRRIRERIRANPTSPFARRIGTATRGEARHLAGALADGDPIARAVLDEIAADLTFGLSHVIHLFHPEVIVLGGGLSLVGEPLRAAVATAIPSGIMEAFAPGPAIRLAGLGEESVPVGALLLARDRVSGGQ